jgi:hypothetical protein
MPICVRTAERSLGEGARDLTGGDLSTQDPPFIDRPPLISREEIRKIAAEGDTVEGRSLNRPELGERSSRLDPVAGPIVSY